MNYRISVAQPLVESVPAIGAAQLDAAIARLKSSNVDHGAIHAARKHFKRTRALLDLIKPAAESGALKTSRKHLSAAAQTLAASRDAQVAVGAAEALEKEFGTKRNSRAFCDLASRLRARRERVDERLNRAGLDEALKDLKKAKADLFKLDLRRVTMSSLLQSASETYRRGRHAMKKAFETGEEEHLHAWRKHVQRHWRHMRLLKAAWPAEAKARMVLVRSLADVLGTHHDLAMLREIILADRDVFNSAGDAKVLCRCIDRKQASLSGEAASLGQRLYSEKPKAFLKRLQAHWHGSTRERAGVSGPTA